MAKQIVQKAIAANEVLLHTCALWTPDMLELCAVVNQGDMSCTPSQGSGA